jgi:PhnB protein
MTDATAFPPMPAPKARLHPYVTVEGAVAAAAFYEKAFAAEVAFMVPPDEQGRTMHVHLYINEGSLMLTDAYPEHGHAFEGHKGSTIQLHVDDADAWAERAVAAGCTVDMPVQDMFWGHRWGSVTDPYGVHWAFDAAPR